MNTANELVRSGFRPNTQKTYSSAQRQYLEFCRMYNKLSLPCDEDTMLMYISYLHSVRKLKCPTIKVYMSAVRALHSMHACTYTVHDSVRLKLALKAIEFQNGRVDKKFAITYEILSHFRMHVSSDHDGKMLWAAMTAAHFGCLRTAEFVSLGELSFNRETQLTRGDISLSPLGHSELGLAISLRCTKTDKTGNGVTVMVGCTGTSVCAVCAMAEYLTVSQQSNIHEPLFRWQDGTFLTRTTFVRETKKLVAILGLDSSQYSGHSYRIGGATSAALAGFSPIELKLLGRWTSEAYEGYIRTPASILFGFSKRMAGLGLVGH